MEPENIFDPPPFYGDINGTYRRGLGKYFTPSRVNYGINIDVSEACKDLNEKLKQMGAYTSRNIQEQYTVGGREAMTQYAQNYSTGAVRDTTPDKLRYDLIDVGWLIALEAENRQEEQYDDGGNATVSPYSDLDNVLECLYLALSKNDPSGLLRATNMIVADYLDYNQMDRDKEGAAFGMPCPILTNLAKHLTETSKHYGYDNWRKGIPLSSYHQSFLRHYISWLNSETDEDHFSACLFNLLGLWYTTVAVMYGRLPAELEDLSPGQFRSLEWVR